MLAAYDDTGSGKRYGQCDAYPKLHVMDIGIALCHLYLAASHDSLFGGFEREQDGIYKKDAEYILSVKM